MLSLGNAFTDEDLQGFDKRIHERLKSDEIIEYVAEPKFDGLSISLLYENGRLLRAFPPVAMVKRAKMLRWMYVPLKAYPCIYKVRIIPNY